MASLGAECSFIGAVGNDVHGGKLVSLLTKHNVDLSQLKTAQGATANNRIINDEFGERFGEQGAWQGGVFESHRFSDDNWDYIKTFDIWSTHSSCPNFTETLKRKGSNFLCVDYLHLPKPDILINNMGKVDIAYVGGDISMREMLLELSKSTQTLLVLTLGSEGSAVFDKGECYYQKAISVDNIIDTTGCGDAFQSGFTYEYFINRNIKQALEKGAIMGGYATQHYGAIEW